MACNNGLFGGNCCSSLSFLYCSLAAAVKVAYSAAATAADAVVRITAVADL